MTLAGSHTQIERLGMNALATLMGGSSGCVSPPLLPACWLSRSFKRVTGSETGCLGGGSIRGEGGDVLVGVTSIFASGARARVKFFIFYFFHHGHPPYLSKNKKK